MSRPNGTWGDRLAARLRDARAHAHPAHGVTPTQKWLAGQFSPPRTHQQISSWERGVEIPPSNVLGELFVILRGADATESQAAEFADWLTDWSIVVAERDLRQQHPALLDGSLKRLADSVTDVRYGAGGPLTSLTEFPGDGPLTVIFGDRREQQAKSAADCLIYSVSTADITNITALCGRPEHMTVCSDKLLVRMSDDALRACPEIAESDLLIVGSPAVNWGARILNATDGIFTFRFDDDVVERDKTMRADARMREENFAGAFWDLARIAESADDSVRFEDRAVEKLSREYGAELVSDAAGLVREVLGNSTARAMTDRFRSMGVLDPADLQHHAEINLGSNDFAVVTLARNPWSISGRHRAVICAGIRGRGTAAALRELLTHPERFENHPLGAVLDVRVDRALDWPSRFNDTRVVFRTGEYAAAGVLDHLHTALGAAPGHRHPVLGLMSDDALRSRAEFVASIVEDGA